MNKNPILSPSQTVKLWSQITEVLNDLYENNVTRRNLKRQGVLLSQACRIQRRLVASAIATKGK